MARSTVHRTFYPNAKHGQNPREVKPVAKAAPVVDARGVHLEFVEPQRAYTPNELKNLARWLYSLAHEATDLVAGELITETTGYNVVEGKVVAAAADT